MRSFKRLGLATDALTALSVGSGVQASAVVSRAAKAVRQLLTPRVVGRMLPLCLAFAVTTPADATLFTATYTGTVSSGYAQTQLYNDPGIMLTGLAYEATYYFDTDLGTRTTSPSLDNLFGEGSNSPVSAVVKIGTTTFVVTGQYYGQERVKDEPGFQSVFSYSEDSTITQDGPSVLYFGSKFYNEVSDDLGRIFDSPIITQSIDFDVDQIDAVGSGYFSFYDRRSADAPGDGHLVPYYINLYQGTSVIDHVVIRSLGGTPPMDSPVPEPRAWLLMLSGFAIAGSALRARRSGKRADPRPARGRPSLADA